MPVNAIIMQQAILQQWRLQLRGDLPLQHVWARWEWLGYSVLTNHQQQAIRVCQWPWHLSCASDRQRKVSLFCRSSMVIWCHAGNRESVNCCCHCTIECSHERSSRFLLQKRLTICFCKLWINRERDPDLPWKASEGRYQLVYIQYMTRKTYLFPRIRCVGFPKVAAWQYADAHAAIRGSSAWQCADAPRILKSADERASLRTRSKTGIGCWSSILQSRYRWGALSIGQPFCHSHTTAYVARLSWIIQDNHKLAMVTNLRSKLLCVCRCERTSRRFESFRSFNTAYEGSLLRVYVEALCIAMYIRTCWFTIFHTNPQWKPAFCEESCGKLQQNRAENPSASAWISMSACTGKSRNSSEKCKISVSSKYRRSWGAHWTSESILMSKYVAESINQTTHSGHFGCP